MLQLDNRTPFVSTMFLFPDVEGVDTLFVVAKATFTFSGRAVALAPKPRPVILADTHLGEPGASSLVFASEAHLGKPTTDVAVVGRVLAPGGRPTTSCPARVTVGPVEKLLQVFGDRTWRTGIGGQRPTPPEPFTEMPLSYERAFGGSHEPGSDRGSFEPRNPVGVGFRGKRSAAEMEGTKLPNIEGPTALIQSPGDRPPPAGLGLVAPSWEPRRRFAGTYDNTWRETRAPYLPLDFDPRFFQAAHPDLVTPAPLAGGEPVELVNLSPGGVDRFSLPICRIDVGVDLGDRVERPRMTLETVLFEPSEALFSMTFRGSVPCDKQALRIERVSLALGRLEGVAGT